MACRPSNDPNRVPNQSPPYGQECQAGDEAWYGYSFWQISDGNFGLGVTSGMFRVYSILEGPVVGGEELISERKTILNDLRVVKIQLMVNHLPLIYPIFPKLKHFYFLMVANFQ